MHNFKLHLLLNIQLLMGNTTMEELGLTLSIYKSLTTKFKLP